jgi:hypothetical protein
MLLKKQFKYYFEFKVEGNPRTHIFLAELYIPTPRDNCGNWFWVFPQELSMLSLTYPLIYPSPVPQ